ncbi:MAG: hypothetical protein GQ474_01645 [Sulfurimonas sp.]|nr:hypothetical protein [Sulfurimonas sp.]
MAYNLIHNHDTSIKTLAKMLNDTLSKIPNLNGSSELDLCASDIVSLTKTSLASDIDKLTRLLNNEDNNPDTFLPQVIIAQSNTIQPSQFTRTMKKFQMHDVITLVNKNDVTEKITLSGQMFSYETPIQIVILSRTQYASKELALHTLNILANNERINYQLRLHDTNNPSSLYSVDDYGHLNLVGVKSMSFSESIEADKGMVIIAGELILRENFFMLSEDNDIMTNWNIQVAVKSDGSTPRIITEPIPPDGSKLKESVVYDNTNITTEFIA